MNLEKYNVSGELDPNAFGPVWSAKSAQDVRVKMERAYQKDLVKEEAHIAREHEKAELTKIQIEELRNWKEQQIQLNKSAEKRENFNTALAIAGILLGLASYFK